MRIRGLEIREMMMYLGRRGRRSLIRIRGVEIREMMMK